MLADENTGSSCSGAMSSGFGESNTTSTTSPRVSAAAPAPGSKGSRMALLPWPMLGGATG
jgi:hypothetical protein